MVYKAKFSGVFFGSMPKGEEIRLSKGGQENGPTILPVHNSFSSLAAKILGCSFALHKFEARGNLLLPTNPTRNPNKKP